MGVLNRDDFFDRINKIVGTDTTDTTLAFIEDMTDTYNSLEKNANNNSVDWEKKYNDLNNAWKEKYKKRFFTGNSSLPITENNQNEDKEIGIDDLFK